MTWMAWVYVYIFILFSFVPLWGIIAYKTKMYDQMMNILGKILLYVLYTPRYIRYSGTVAHISPMVFFSDKTSDWDEAVNEQFKIYQVKKAKMECAS